MELPGLPLARHSEADHLAQRVNSGVGSAGGVGGHAQPGDSLEHAFQFTLDRSVRFLSLPAGEVAADVVKHRVAGKTRHGRKR